MHLLFAGEYGRAGMRWDRCSMVWFVFQQGNEYKYKYESVMSCVCSVLATRLMLYLYLF